MRREMERRVPSAVRLVRVGAGLQQRMARWLTKMDQRVMEGREASFVAEAPCARSCLMTPT